MNNPLTQYCYTLPEIYGEYYDLWDIDTEYYNVDEDFNAGNTIKFSKICSADWHAVYQTYGSILHFNCDNINAGYSNLFNCESTLEHVLSKATPSPDGYITLLNCPICGCTPGQNDAITMYEREEMNLM